MTTGGQNGPPTLVYLFNNFRGGAITNIVRDLQPFVGAQYDVHVVALQAIDQDAYMVDEFRAIGITIHTLRTPRWNMLLAGARLRRTLRDLRPAIVHAHAGRASILAPWCSPPGIPVFVTYHNIASSYNFFTRSVMPRADRLITGSSAVSDTVASSWGEVLDRAPRVIYNPVNIANFQRADLGTVNDVRQELGVPQGALLLLNVGRLVRAKGQDVLLRAVATLASRRGNDFRLVIAGRGPAEAALRALAQHLGIQRWVIFAGFRHDIPRLLSAADLFVMPSRWEGLPVAALEAVAAATPVVASDIPSIGTFLTRGVSATLVPPNDAEALTEALCSIMADRERRFRMANAAQDAIRVPLAPRRIADAYLRMYDSGSRRPVSVTR